MVVGCARAPQSCCCCCDPIADLPHLLLLLLLIFCPPTKHTHTYTPRNVSSTADTHVTTPTTTLPSLSATTACHLLLRCRYISSSARVKTWYQAVQRTQGTCIRLLLG